ncbi:hypothetical protein RJT34_15858 [Clitoria ternatea]|uniref:Uncharacterized protein n=1 Tax=Clitoria ternatea TaxID=43366 RepID=A0AAN9PBU1_CLITE
MPGSALHTLECPWAYTIMHPFGMGIKTPSHTPEISSRDRWASGRWLAWLALLALESTTEYFASPKLKRIFCRRASHFLDFAHPN